MVFHWRLSDSQSPQVSRTLLRILAVFNNAVWMVSTRPPTYKSSWPFNNDNNNKNYHYYYYYYLRDFTPAKANVISLKSVWQQVSSSLQDSSQYFSRSQQYSSLDSLQSSSYFQVDQYLYQSLGDYNERTN